MTITTVNPATEEIVSTYPAMSAAQIEDMVHNSDAASRCGDVSNSRTG